MLDTMFISLFQAKTHCKRKTLGIICIQWLKRLTWGLGLCLFQKTGAAQGADIMEIIPHRPSDPGFKPATFQSQVQLSTGWKTEAPKYPMQTY